MSNSLKQARRLMLVVFAATIGMVACDSATAPDVSVAETLRVVDHQVDEADLMENLEIERFRDSDSKTPAE